MCTSALYSAVAQQQQQAHQAHQEHQQAKQPITDSDITPDGSVPLMIRQLKPEAPPGYVARFVDGRWKIILDPRAFRNGRQPGSAVSPSLGIGGGGAGFGGSGGGGNTGPGGG